MHLSANFPKGGGVPLVQNLKIVPELIKDVLQQKNFFPPVNDTWWKFSKFFPNLLS